MLDGFLSIGIRLQESYPSRRSSIVLSTIARGNERTAGPLHIGSFRPILDGRFARQTKGDTDDDGQL